MLETQKYAIASIIKSWEVFLLRGICMNESLTNSRQHKNALMNHLAPYMDDSFDKLKGRECYNSFVGALTDAGLVSSNLVKEIYTQEEVDYMESRGVNVDDLHILESSDENLLPF